MVQGHYVDMQACHVLDVADVNGEPRWASHNMVAAVLFGASAVSLQMHILRDRQCSNSTCRGVGGVANARTGSSKSVRGISQMRAT